DYHRLFDAAEVQEDQERDGGVLRGKLPSVKRGGEKAEGGVAASRDGDRDRQDVVDDERAAGDDAGARAQESGGHDVTAAPARELVDDVPVGRGEDDHGQGGRHREHDREIGVLTEHAERFLGAVGG